MILFGGESAARLVLDTSAYSHFRAGHPRVLDLMAAAEAVVMPTVVLGELEAGFQLGSREGENRSLLAEFLTEPFVSIVQVTPSVARHYGRLFADLRRAGTPLPINDVWIAAVTLDCGGHLLTFDEHFDDIPSLVRTVLPVPGPSRRSP
jgi:tRNA(fMet)-specific endonuclease VapC